MTSKSKVWEKEKIPLDTALWSVVYRHLIENGVQFPRGNWKTIGICYGGYTKIGEVLKEYKIKI